MVDAHNVTLAAFDGVVLQSSSATAPRYAALPLIVAMIGYFLNWS